MPSQQDHTDSADSVGKGKCPMEWTHAAAPSGMARRAIDCTVCAVIMPLEIVTGKWAVFGGMGSLFNGLGGTSPKMEALTVPEEVKAVMIPRQGLSPCDTSLPFQWVQAQSAAMP